MNLINSNPRHFPNEYISCVCECVKVSTLPLSLDRSSLFHLNYLYGFYEAVKIESLNILKVVKVEVNHCNIGFCQLSTIPPYTGDGHRVETKLNWAGHTHTHPWLDILSTAFSSHSIDWTWSNDRRIYLNEIEWKQNTQQTITSTIPNDKLNANTKFMMYIPGLSREWLRMVERGGALVKNTTNE